MFIRRNQKLNKRGFSLAETVLALAVISISSVGVLSLVLSAQRATMNAAQKQQAQLYAMDIINCYRVDGDFTENVKFALGQTENNTFDVSNITLNHDMTANVSVEEQTITVVITKNDKPLTKRSFTKGELNNEETP